MDKFPMMVFRAPGPEFVHGLSVGLELATTVDEEDLSAAKSAGWYESTTEAVAAYEAEREALVKAAANANSMEAAPSRAELEVKAKELGIKFDEFTTDGELLSAIDEKLKNS
jgi:hypothetical protein